MIILPNADKAIIPIEKLSGYALNPVREPNKSKAYKDALGYDMSNAAALADNIRNNLKYFNAVEKPDNGYGKRYEVLMSLTGINGKNANVLTAWIVDNNTGETRLISTYITKKRIKEFF